MSDDALRGLLLRHGCRLPLHAVRTFFLGVIASPGSAVSPIGAAEALFGGELPVFDSEKDANALIGGLIVGLWNRLSEHQDRSKPFRLTRVDVPATHEGLARIALIRREEIVSFREGLFGGNESLDLPERAHQALGVLSQMRAMIEGTREVAERTANSAESDDAKALLQQFRELTRIAEHEMHEAVLACIRARRQTRPAMH
nr:hypothetical protein [uncultured Rhodopila sp.]